MTAKSASDVVERARTGDERAFAALVREHDPRLRALANRLLARPDRLDDVMQEAYVRAYRSLHRFRSEADIGTWLYRITYNCCVDELRAEQRRPFPTTTVADRPDRASQPDTRVTVQETVRAALEELPVPQRAAVVLVDGEGFDYGTAAEILSVARGTVASRVARARRSLRAALAPDQEVSR